MNAIAKATLFVIAGMGTTWVVREATEAFGAGRASGLMQAQQPAAPAAGTPAPVKPLSREEMEEELRKAQAAIAAGGAPEPGKGGGTKEFRPTKPLPADLPVALPSDI